MSNQLSQLLQQWYPRRDSTEWVLGTVYKTEGPCYRKAGAMMLYDGLGQQFGLLSGGCLESDIQTHARKVMQTGEAVTLCYDGSDEDDISFQLGIGCGGKVHILLQLVNRENDYLCLDSVLQSLADRNSGEYRQFLPSVSRDAEGMETVQSAKSAVGEGCPLTLSLFEPCENAGKTGLTSGNGITCFTIAVNPEPHLLIVGGGVDARPVVSIARELGWAISMCDPRPANARADVFGRSLMILRDLDESLADYCMAKRVDAVIVMTHNVGMDAAAISILHQVSGLKYMALLGPSTRKAKVLDVANVDEKGMSVSLSGPAGFDIGGELPESIALSMLAECHEALFVD